MTDRPFQPEPQPEERIADLIGVLPPVPDSWVQTAAQMPGALRRLEATLARAQADGDLRKALNEDPARALEREGIEPDAALLAVLRARM